MVVGREVALHTLFLRCHPAELRHVVIDAQYSEGPSSLQKLYSEEAPIVQTLTVYVPAVDRMVVSRTVMVKGTLRYTKLNQPCAPNDSIQYYRNLRFVLSRMVEPIHADRGYDVEESEDNFIVSMHAPFDHRLVVEVLTSAAYLKIGPRLDKLEHALKVHYGLHLSNYVSVGAPITGSDIAYIQPTTRMVDRHIEARLYSRVCQIYRTFIGEEKPPPPQALPRSPTRRQSSPTRRQSSPKEIARSRRKYGSSDPHTRLLIEVDVLRDALTTLRPGPVSDPRGATSVPIGGAVTGAARRHSQHA